MCNHSLKTQSILEYIIILAAVVVFILISTVGLGSGFNRGLSRNLNQRQRQVERDYTKRTRPPQEIQNQAYYAKPAKDLHEEDKGYIVGGHEKAGKYYFHEGPSDMSWVPQKGTITEEHSVPFTPMRPFDSGDLPVRGERRR